MTQKTEYCLGPIDNNYSLDDDFLPIHGQYLTFDKLRQLNINTTELLSWSATIDLAEKYEYYLQNQDNSSLSTEIFFNCTNPWFGPQCQFSFDSITTDSFQEFILDRLTEIYKYESPYNIPTVTCYTHLECDRGGSGLCLDWREICDGRIDCIDGGADEEQCFHLEVNECNEDEYRCHNGFCIPKEVLPGLTSECLDKSDVVDPSFTTFLDRYPHIFHHEEHSCSPSFKQFVCGDGECVADFDECKSKRHLLLIESISGQGNFSYTCWMIMICLTKILDQVNKTSCDQLLRSSAIDTCDDLIQFPTVPVLFGHVRFLYNMKEAKDWNIDLLFLPNSICYDHQLCDFLIPTYRYGNYSCRNRHQFNFDWNIKHKTWSSFIHLVEYYFRKCLTKSIKNASHHSSLYCCQNSSKCISKHRIIDNISDCYLNDDEEQFELSCLIDDVLRFRCANENKCYSSSVPREICPRSVLRKFNDISFQELCDRQMHMFPLIIHGQNHTDETDCEHWPCNNFYTRCDGFWNCPDGEDEENCTKRICPSHSLPCVTPYNYTFTCLSANQVDNGHIDCLGAIDEGQYCRSLRYLERNYLPFRCWNDDSCLKSYDLCNGYANCPHADDEKFCKNYNRFGICGVMNAVDRTDIENAICLTINMNKIQFSFKTSPIYPPSKNKTFGHIAQQPSNILRLITNERDDSAWLWRCNHGLYVRHWLGGNKFAYKCFCPPSYYGNLCQYQNQRVSLTIQVRVLTASTVYEIVISLIDDNDDRQQIISYQQYTSIVECEQNWNTYLSYATRPKNSSTNYSLRIDIYNKTSLTYLASWHFSVLFSFLPVNRMAVVVYVPAEEDLTPMNCPFTCHNSKCMKYINKDKFYCQCNAGWSGVQCDIPVRCNDCSLDSMCVGVIYNRSICICPLNKRSPRCLSTLSCPDSFCYNNGTCLVNDDDMNELIYECICPMGFATPRCEKPYGKLDISIHNIKVSSVLLIYIFFSRLFSDNQRIIPNVIAQKLTIFQRFVSVYIKEPVSMCLVKTDDSYYLAALQHDGQKSISTSIDSSRRCASITELLSIEQLTWHEIRRVKYNHKICQTHLHMMCFIDDPYMCLCTLEHHANCFRFDSTPPKCRDKFYCRNGGTCFQDHLKCPSRTTMCNCTDCFFGSQCQFYARGIGLTLDDILRYEIRPHVTIYDQSSIIKWSSALIMIIFVAGLINSILSLLTFHTKQSRTMGCGMYLLASSITSFLTVSILTVKFWFLVGTQINPSVSRSVLRGSCISFEFILKVCLYLNNWFNACVALERLTTVYKGIHFNKMLSKRIAPWIIFTLPLLIMVSIIHEPLYRDLFDDKDEQRSWCVFYYSSSVQIYNTIIILLHFIGPFSANLLSALYIIFASTRRRAITQQQLTYNQHLRENFKEHKNLIISPIILVILAIPGLIISISSECVKESYNSWLYLSGYLISFVPSMTIFIVFVLPSDFYKEQFKGAIKFGRR